MPFIPNASHWDASKPRSNHVDGHVKGGCSWQLPIVRLSGTHSGTLGIFSLDLLDVGL